MARSVGILNKLKQTLPQTVMLQLCYALVHPLQVYGIIIWGATYPTYLQKLKSLQNRAIRAIVGAHFRDSVNPYYSQLKTLQIDDLFKFEVAKFVYGFLNNKTQIHSENTSVKLMTAQVELRGSRVIVTI